MSTMVQELDSINPPAGKAPAVDPRAYADGLPESSTQQLSTTVDDAPSRGNPDETVIGYSCGTAYIHEDLELKSVEDNYQALRRYEELFRHLGLKTSSKFGNTPATISLLGRDLSNRRICVFLILAGASSKENAAEFATTLDGVLAALGRNRNPESRKLLVFCRLKDPADPIPDVAKETAVLNSTEEAWKKDHPNIALIYKCCDENNMLCFLNNLEEGIEHLDDPSNAGSCAPVSQVVEKLKKSNTRTGFYHKGLEGDSDLRIEAFKFEDRLLKKMDEPSGQPPFSPLAVPDMDACYGNDGDGRVLIISNEKFAKERRRRGTRIDCENLKHLFHRLGFAEQNIDIRHDLTSAQMTEAVNKFAAVKDCGSCAVLVILTHGREGRLYGVEEATSASPNNWISDQDVIDALSKSPALPKKPKLFIVNACRNPVPSGESQTGLENSDCAKLDESKRKFAEYFLASKLFTTTDNSPGRAGLIVAYSTLPGEECSGLAFSGSRFISSLCWVLHRHAGQEDVLSMINRVNDHITCYKQTGTNPKTGKEEETQMQLPSWAVETTKKFYLVKVVPAAGGTQTGNQELQCPLAAPGSSSGCSFSTHDAKLLAAHHETYAEHHRKLWADCLSENSSLKKDVESKNREISDLSDSVRELKRRLDESLAGTAEP